MNFFEGFVISCSISVFFSIMWKWSKVLLVIILMESLTALVLSLTFIIFSAYMMLVVVMFVFFVSEALILLSSLYSSMRASGLIYSSLVL